MRSSTRRYPGACLLVFGSWLCAAGPSWAQPTIFWASDPVAPDETVILTGDGLSALGAISMHRLIDDERGETPPSVEHLPAEVLAASETVVKVVVPARLAPGVFSLNAAGKTDEPVAVLNAPAIYWVQGDRGRSATPGGWLRVFGRNISLGPEAVLILRRAGAPDIRVKPGAASRWDAGFPLADATMPGSYEMLLWNGRGDRTTWRSAGTIEVAAAPAVSARVLDARGAGAIGNGTIDDAPAVQKALDIMRDAGGGTVRLARGYFRLSTPLTIPDGVTLRGDSRDTTSLVFDDSAAPPPILISGYSRFAIEDLTIVATRHRHIVAGGFPNAAGGSDGRDIALRRVTIRASAFLGRIDTDEAATRNKEMLTYTPEGVDGIRLAGSNLVIEDCDVLSSSRALYLLRSRGARVTGTTFRHGRSGTISIRGSDGVIFERNRIVGADMQAAGISLNAQRPGGSSENIYVAHNTIETLFGWDREGITTDGSGGYFYGRATSQGSRLTLLEPVVGLADTLDWNRATAFVVAGRGRGEYARVTARSGDRVTLATPFAVALDETSLVSVVPTHMHYLVIGNTVEDASVAFQIYGTGLFHVVAGNASVRSWGFYGRALDYSHPQPNWYNQFLENEIRVADPRKPSYLGVWGMQKRTAGVLLNFATLLRNNKLGANSAIELRGFYPQTPGVLDALVEGNSGAGGPGGIAADAGVVGATLRRNR